MSPEHTPLFLARRGYRRLRLADAARVLPLFGGALFCLPLLWKGTERAGGTVQALIYVFGLWVVLITVSALISRHLSPEEQAQDSGRGGDGGAGTR